MNTSNAVGFRIKMCDRVYLSDLGISRVETFDAAQPWAWELSFEQFPTTVEMVIAEDEYGLESPKRFFVEKMRQMWGQAVLRTVAEFLRYSSEAKVCLPLETKIRWHLPDDYFPHLARLLYEKYAIVVIEQYTDEDEYFD